MSERLKVEHEERSVVKGRERFHDQRRTFSGGILFADLPDNAGKSSVIVD